jgi:hypothetical protein
MRAHEWEYPAILYAIKAAQIARIRVIRSMLLVYFFGKQQIRWGRADGFNPTDNIIPYDYLDTFADERLAVPSLKADVYFGRTNFEWVWVPFYTPTRLPILGQRWFPQLPKSAQDFDLVYRDLEGPLPASTLGNGQWGLRYNQILSKREFSFSFCSPFTM